MLDHNKKLEFVHKMAKLGLQHFDTGGGVLSAGNSNPLTGLSGALTVQNKFNAEAPTSAATVGQQQSTLAGQLQNEAAGNGPNPAQIQYGQNAQDIAKEQAQLYSQNRSLNPGLAARLSGEAAVNAKQTAAGNAAAQEAQQQIAAQQEMANLTGQEQSGALTSQAINAQTAQNNVNSVNQTQGGILSGLAQNVPILGSLFADGGEVEAPKKMAVGGSISTPYAPNFSNANVLLEQEKQREQKQNDKGPGPISGVGQFLNSQPTSSNNFGASNFFSGNAPEIGAQLSSAAPAIALMKSGGRVEDVSNPPVYPTALMKKGGSVKAQNQKEKAVVSGDSYKNDKVPAMLSQGEFVIDRDTMNDPGPAGQMARALAKHIQARNGKNK